MSRARDFAQALTGATFADEFGYVFVLLASIAEAWEQAEASPISENEAQRWSRVCSAAERVVGL